MEKRTIVIATLALAIGALAGYALAPERNPPAPKERAPRHAAKHNQPNEGDKATVAALRRRVHELEKQLAEKDAQPVELETREEEPPRKRGEMNFGLPGPEEWRANMEEMKEKNPAKYSQMTNRMAQWRSSSIANTQDRIEFLASIDTSKMSQWQLENHEELQNLLVRREELMQIMDFSNADSSEADRANAIAEMRETAKRIRRLENSERDMLLSQTAKNLGCKGPKVREFIDTVKTIYSATQSFGGGGPGPGGRNMPPPGGR